MNFERLYTTELTRLLNNEDTAVLFTTDRRKDAIRDAEAEFADLTECLIRQSTITCSCNTAEYNLNSSAVLGGSTDFTRLSKQGVEYHHVSSGGVLRTQAGDDFPRRDIEWLNRETPGWRQSTSPTELPRAYYVRTDGGQTFLGLVDRPDIGSSETGKLVVPYVAQPVPMSSTGAEPFTIAGNVRTDLRPYHAALPHFGAYKLLPFVGDFEGANSNLQTFLGYVARYVQAQRPKGGTHVVMGRRYFSETRSRGRDVDLSIAFDTRLGHRV